MRRDRGYGYHKLQVSISVCVCAYMCILLFILLVRIFSALIRADKKTCASFESNCICVRTWDEVLEKAREIRRLKNLGLLWFSNICKVIGSIQVDGALKVDKCRSVA